MSPVRHAPSYREQVLDQQIFPQDPNKAPGDVAGDNWVRYEDDETRTPGLQEEDLSA